MTKERIHEQEGGITWPEWRLYANFLLRELARLWYGKKSIFTPVLVKGDVENAEFWGLFSLIIGKAMLRFGLAHDLTHGEMVKRAKKAVEDYDKLNSQGLAPPSHFLIAVWSIRRTLGDILASEFLYDPHVTQMFGLASGACYYAAKGEMPSYKNARLMPLDFYEWLPIAPELEEQFYGKKPSS